MVTDISTARRARGRPRKDSDAPLVAGENANACIQMQIVAIRAALRKLREAEALAERAWAYSRTANGQIQARLGV